MNNRVYSLNNARNKESQVVNYLWLKWGGNEKTIINDMPMYVWYWFDIKPGLQSNCYQLIWCHFHISTPKRSLRWYSHPSVAWDATLVSLQARRNTKNKNSLSNVNKAIKVTHEQVFFFFWKRNHTKKKFSIKENKTFS